MKGSAWKREPEKFEHDWFSEIIQLKEELDNRTYKTLPGYEFKLNERGKIRHIHGGRMRDRVVRHALCDNILGPYLRPYLIYNNGASQKGKGLSFTRAQFEKDLHNFYLRYGSNEGYVGFVDFSKFFDNIRHDKVKELMYPLIPEDTHWLMDEILRAMEVDVSYMTDEEYSHCMDERFNSVEYHDTIPKELRTGKKFMQKSVNIGDQVSQDIGVFFPYRIDNYVKIVRGIKGYGRYMDDMYIIHPDKEYLEETIRGIEKEAEELGLFINRKKTHICRMKDKFTYLQVRYFVTDTGKVVKRINPKGITRERRKLKAYKRLLDKGDITYEQIEQAAKSWMGGFVNIMSRKQIKNMKMLYQELFGKELRWKK
jgi:uncharacterized short protein YbdD (DUF466 family)